MYEKFLNYFTDYIFVKDEPQKADVIFVPGNGKTDSEESAIRGIIKYANK